ncbi:glycoside hydrolase family 78 protein [Clostridium sp. SHJSY1]|uniref:alpha-L-rhamnosidase n=1 Tax=Clostridium sp. SHJSY1 TaxID=2942483 RepID=UPI00287603C6|nr:family 78 glycoside hydrolase catalytic domain [Clostridium sp. SHJSY1]MDS0524802.1 glycoside hydrolase family 78 protein [Clostridium sp. SHJSY1]
MFLIKKCFTNSNEKNNVIDSEKIYFAWQMESDKNNVVQKAYQLKLVNNKEKIIWETGKIISKNSTNVLYEGPNLESRKEYYWKVSVWNNYNEVSESNFNSFEIGLKNKEDWIGKWIEADIETKSIKEKFNIKRIFSYHPDPKEIENIKLDPPISFSKEFIIKDKKVKKARLYSTAHGVYEVNLNEKKVGDDYLAPGFTSYPKLQYYQTYDITNQIRNEVNRIEIIVADGWYRSKIGLAGIGHQFGKKLALLAQIEVEYVDGEKLIIGTDKSFVAHTGDIEYSDLFIGEKQNHIEKEKFFYGIIETDYGYKQLKSDLADPIKCIEKIKAVDIITTQKGEKVIDFGRNLAGIVEIKVKGQKGDVVQLQHTEELDLEGNFFVNNMGQNKFQTNTFVLKGNEEEVFIPKFTYQGFRYVKVTGYPGEINKDNFTAYVLSTNCKRTGNIETSNSKINRLIENIYHSQESNFISVPTDCPQREKGGWTGDAQIYTPTAIFNMKIDNFMRRWLENMRVDQYENGQIPGLIPWIESDNMLSNSFGNISTAGWADACIIIPWHLYIQYDDINYLKDNYEMMKKWINYVKERCMSNVLQESKEYEKYIWNMDFHYGDWMTPSCTKEDGSIDPMLSSQLTAEQVATMYYAYSSELLSKIAGILGKKTDKEYYADLSNKVKYSFNEVFVDSEGKISNDLQGLYALAAHFNMGSDEVNKKFIDRLTFKIKENGNKLDTGFLGTPILLDVLTNYGEKDLAYKLLFQEECPSWLYMVKQGATTIWECWDAIKPDGNKSIISYNHYSLGSVQDYIVRKIGGLVKLQESGKYMVDIDLESPFEYCNLSYESIYGTIEVNWDFREDKSELSIVVPIGATILVKLSNEKNKVFESGSYKIDMKR